MKKTHIRWTGPISVALFVPDVEFTIALVFIEYLRNCFPNVRNRVSFHMIYPGKETCVKMILASNLSHGEDVFG